MQASRVLTGMVWVLGMFAAGGDAASDDRRFEIGARGIMVTAGGEPANDMISVGLYGTYRPGGGRWFVGGALDQYGYDFERPWRIVGLEQDSAIEVVDASTDATTVSGWIGKGYGEQQRRLKWFWSAGLGFSAPDVDDVTGPVAGGGTFDITTDPGSEFIVSAAGGLRQLLGQRFALQFALRADHHVADWEVRDRVSGNTGSISGYTGLGAHVGFGMRF